MRRASAAPVAPPSAPPARRGLWLLGPALLFVAACAFGVLEVHSSTDTWIGLAAGRQILTSEKFPVKDTFSYTTGGRVWLNQNWLSHVFFWALYNYLGRTALVIGNWLVAASIFVSVLLATRLRCGSWLAATFAASLVAIACRDWLSIRPATIQFVLLAAAWLGFSALLRQDSRHRWWPLGLLLAVFAVWTHAHGSFIFGFGLLGMFLGCVILARIFRQPAVLTWRQTALLAAIGVVTAALGVLLSPYGIENYTHPFTIAKSELFRQVGEWHPPFVNFSKFPPVGRFWAALTVAIVAPLATLAFRRLGRQPTEATAPSKLRVRLNTIVFDLLSIGVGLFMAFSARRFAPIFYILATPALTTFTLWLARPIAARVRNQLRDALVVGAWPAALVTLAYTGWWAHADLIAGYEKQSQVDLLDRVTQNNARPTAAFEFLRRNHLTPNILTEWKVAGAIMFELPGCRVFIDGRAQQVYTEQEYMAYMWLLGLRANQESFLPQFLTNSGTELVLLPRWPAVRELSAAMNRVPGWIHFFDTPSEAMWIASGSRLLAELGQRERAGTLEWPDIPSTPLMRGLLLANTWPPDMNRAREFWKEGIALDPEVALEAHGLIVKTLVQEGRADEARAYVRDEREKLRRQPPPVAPELQRKLNEALDKCEQLAGGGTPP